MSGNAVIIAGAGFSRLAGGPLLRELLTDEWIGRSRASRMAMESIRGLLKDPGVDPSELSRSLEAIFTTIWDEQYTGRVLDVDGTPYPARDLLKELRLHLGSICADVRLDFRSSAAKLYVGYLRQLFQESRSLTVVTFNYDTVIEQALDRGGLDYSYGPHKVVRFVDKSRQRVVDKHREDVRILKLHGSVNWGICRECSEAPRGADLINAVEGSYVPPRNLSCHFCDKPYLLPSIVSPVLTKGTALQPFEAIWKSARTALSRAREIVVVGYSLPPADTQALDLIRQVKGPPFRPRVMVVCGEQGAPRTYNDAFARFTDAKCSFEEYMVHQLE
jgi:hypothetical protein